jgi:IS1 family transposase
MNQLDRKTRTKILHALCEGVSVRSVARLEGVNPGTVLRLLADAGDMAIMFMKHEMKDLICRFIQADELYSFVGTRDFEPDEDEIEAGLGRTWTWLAIDAETKLVISYHIGSRGLEDGTTFMKGVASKLKRDEQGRFHTVPQLVTDGLPSYLGAVDEAFGKDVHYGRAVKIYEDILVDGKKTGRKRYRRTERRVETNNPTEAQIHTCYIERQNLNLRMQNRRFTRKTNGFSKKLLNHERQLALWAVYYNFVWVPTRGDGVTAATRHALRPEIWEVSHLLALTEQFVKARKEEQQKLLAAPSEPASPQPDRSGLPTHWVYQSFTKKNCKVHLATCSNCRDGAGRGAKKTSGKWYPFFSLEQAVKGAEAIHQDRSTICNMCIGEYRQRTKTKW